MTKARDHDVAVGRALRSRGLYIGRRHVGLIRSRLVAIETLLERGFLPAAAPAGTALVAASVCGLLSSSRDAGAGHGLRVSD